LPATGTIGGILAGFDNRKFEVIVWQNNTYCVSAIFLNNQGKFVWRFITGYCSPYEEGKLEFI
jgi:hypothetical protein